MHPSETEHISQSNISKLRYFCNISVPKVQNRLRGLESHRKCENNLQIQNEYQFVHT